MNNNRRLPLLAGVVGATVLVLVALLWYPPLYQNKYQPHPGPFASLENTDTVNLNTAGVEQLCLLPGIGQTRAEAIVAYREEHGSFSNLEQLQQVPGIGAATLKKLEGLVSL